MTTAIVRSGFDTWVNEAKSTTNYARDKHLVLDATGAAGRAYVYFAVPAPRDSTVTSATLRVYAYKASTGARTISVKRVPTAWSVSKMKWTNKPASSGTAATVAISTLAEGTAIDIDVTDHVQAIVNGAANYGFEITTSSATRHYLYSLEGSGNLKPYLTVEWSEDPAKPTKLNPANGVVSITKPTLQFDYADVSTPLAAVQVQIDPAADEVSPDFDHTEPTTAPQLNLSTTAFAGLAEGVPTQWRVRVQDGGGRWSEWSDWTSLTKTAKTSPTITNMATGIVYETTPPVLWTFANQTAWQVLVFDAANLSTPVHDSLKQGGTDTGYTIAAGVLRDDRPYVVEVRCWDDVTARVATPGDTTYSSTTQNIVVDEDPTVGGVSSLTVSAVGITPVLDFEWTRSTTPDSWTIYEDGKPIVADLDPAQVFVSGTTYRYTFYGARPKHEHTYSVRAVVNGKMSAAGITDSVMTSPEGIWLVDTETGLTVTLWGSDDGTWNMTDDATVYTPIGSSEVVRIISGMRGLEGSLPGFLMEGFGKTFSEQEADLYALKSRPTSVVRLVLSDENIESIVGNIKIAPLARTRNGRIMKAVSLDFWQVGDLPFDPNL